MRITLVSRPGAGEIFADDAFDSQIGKTVPFTINGQRFDTAKLVQVKVAEGGGEAWLTYDLPDSARQWLNAPGGSPSAQSASLGFSLPPVIPGE